MQYCCCCRFVAVAVAMRRDSVLSAVGVVYGVVLQYVCLEMCSLTPPT